MTDAAEKLDPAPVLKTHAAAECFRMMDDEELAALAADIAENGLRDPIIIGRVNGAASDAIVDGRNRLKACELANVEPRFETVLFKDDDAVRAFIKSRGERRNITASQKAMALAMLYRETRPGKRTKGSATTLSAANKVSTARISQARTVLRFSEELARAVRDGMSLDAALEEVYRASSTVDNEKSKRQLLQQEAPDLFELVLKHENGDTGGMPLNEAAAALDERQRDIRAIIEHGRRASTQGLTDFIGTVAALHGAKQLGAHDLLDARRFKEILHAAETLKEIVE